MEQEIITRFNPESKEKINSELSLSFANIDILLRTPDTETVKFCKDYFENYAIFNLENNRDVEKWLVQWRSDERESLEIDTSGRTINIFSMEPDMRQVMRIIRSLVMLKDIDSGMTMFKGAALKNKNGHGVVLFGEKRTGKTSLVLSMMLENHPEDKFITNSQVTLGIEGDSLLANGYPMSMGVRLNVLESMEKRGNQNVGELITTLKETMEPGGENRYYLDPKVLKTLFNGRIEAGTAVNALVILRRASSKDEFSFKRLGPNEVLDYLIDYHQRFYNRDGSGWYKLFDVDFEREISNIENIVEMCPIYELTYSVDHHQKALDVINGI